MNRLILDFLNDLKESNNREWFQQNKARYDQARGIFESFINDLIPRIRIFDPSVGTITARDCVFRIYRDVRFSGDKSPYKPNMGAYIARGGRTSAMAGYYVHFESGSSFLAGGLYMPSPEVLKRIREEIYYQPEEFIGIINHPNFRKYFGGFEDEGRLKKPPRGFPADFPYIEWLKYRSYAVMHPVDDQQVMSETYIEYARDAFLALHPLISFFNKLFL